jgi:hypothetical protein
LLGDDHVGVDIDHLQRRRDAFERGEFFHLYRLLFYRPPFSFATLELLCFMT